MDITRKPKIRLLIILLAFNTFLTHAKFYNVIAFLSVLKTDYLISACYNFCAYNLAFLPYTKTAATVTHSVMLVK